MSSNGVPIQEISDTVGHKSTHVTETVYRHAIVLEIRGGATVMDGVFSDDEDGDEDAWLGLAKSGVVGPWFGPGPKVEPLPGRRQQPAARSVVGLGWGIRRLVPRWLRWPGPRARW